MKYKITSAVAALIMSIGIVAPQSASALSCIDPESMLEYYVSDENLTIFTAKAGETKEFTKEKATEAHMQDSGYTGQYLEVSEAHKGYPEEKQWVYYTKDANWGYLCAGGPATPGTETLYVVNTTGGLFDLTTVVHSYEADSDLAKDIVEALEAAETDNEPTVSEVSSEDWQNRLRTDLSEMIFVLRVKLAELRFSK